MALPNAYYVYQGNEGYVCHNPKQEITGGPERDKAEYFKFVAHHSTLGSLAAPIRNEVPASMPNQKTHKVTNPKPLDPQDMMLLYAQLLSDGRYNVITCKNMTVDIK